MDKGKCPTCGRTVGLLKDRTVRRHKQGSAWCEGGRVRARGEAQVLPIRGKRDRSNRLTPEERAAVNRDRPDSRQLPYSGFGPCGAKIRDKASGTWSGETCLAARGWGTDHVGFGRCKKHGGKTPTGQRHAALERARAEAEKVRQAQTFYGRRAAVDPEQALLEEMQRSVGVVRWLESAIAEWGQFERLAAEIAATDPAPDDETSTNAAEAMLDRLLHRGRRILDGEAVTEHVSFDDSHTGLPSLVAVHSTERAVGFTDTEYRAWLKVYHEERRQLTAVAKACIDANIAERRQQVLESRGEMIRRLVLIALRLAGLQLDDEKALAIVAEATRTVAKELPA